jgi:hypothetical protein
MHDFKLKAQGSARRRILNFDFPKFRYSGVRDLTRYLECRKEEDGKGNNHLSPKYFS